MKITLAALLHDIGKFYQRTGMKLTKEHLYQQCVKPNGSYAHGGFTAKFIDENLNSKIDDFSGFLYLSAGHHVDANSIIKTADQIASGHDRRDPRDEDIYEKKDLEESTRKDYIKKRLFTIFNEVRVNNNLENGNKKFYSIDKLSKFTLNDFDGSLIELEKAKEEYKNLYLDMEQVLKDKGIREEKSYDVIHNILYPIIKEYTGLIPANTFSENVQTVSLFDHLKLTAAIARCLEFASKDEFLIVDYDLSGIQAFIYKITEGRNSKPNIAKMLRTRSFYLNIFSDFIAYAIANEFKLSYENVLYSSGGRGRLLVPNTEESIDILNEFNKKLEKEVFAMFKGDISFSISYFITDAYDLKHLNLDDITSFNKINRVSAKNQKFKTVLNEKDFSYVGQELSGLCDMCNTNSAAEGKMCKFCDSLLNLNDLVLAKKNEFLIEFDYHNESGMENADFYLGIGSLGKINFYLKANEVKPRENSFYLSINDCYLGETKYYARSNITKMSFEDIAQNSYGDKKIAVVKMDVDNLGYIFLRGIKKDNETISKILTLSRTMDTFFSKRIAEICKKPQYKQSVYINYSGGDDLVIILPASMSLELVEDINKEFAEFTAYNNDLHISAGIEIFKPKSPIRYAVDMAEDNLSKAKSLDSKACVGVLDVVIPNNKISELLKEIELFTKELEKEDSCISRGFVYDVYSSLLSSLDNKEPSKAFQRFIPLIAYNLKRNISDEKWFNKLAKIFVNANVTKEIMEFYKVVLGFALMKTNIGGKNV